MIIYLYGPDSYRRNQKLREVINEYRKKRGVLGFSEIDIEETEKGWVSVRDFLNQPSIFTIKKLLAVKNLDLLPKEERKSASSDLKKYVTDEDIFVIISDDGKLTKEFGFLLEEPVRYQVFDELPRKELEIFVRSEIETRELALEARALNFLLDYLMSGGDRAWRAVNEAEKISLAKFGPSVSPEDVKKIISWLKTDESFGLALQLLKSDSVRDRLIVLERLRLRGDEERHILNLLCSLAKNRNDVLGLARADERLKSGGLDDEVALLDFVLRD